MAAEKPFRAIIIGGGPVGLAAGHVFTKAGIDFVILERRKEYDLISGASIALWPHNVRILDQLGLLEEAEQIYMPLRLKRAMRRDGSEIARNNLLEVIGANHGHPWMCFHRAKLIEMLYRRLPNNSTNVVLGAEVVSIENTETGVVVKCADETTYNGSIVIGADGTHSTVRRHINQDLKQEAISEPFRAAYRGLYGNGPVPHSILPGTYYETHGQGLTIQLIPGEKEQQFLIYERLTPSQIQQQGQKFTSEEMEEMAKSFADVRFTEEVTFADIWREKRWAACDQLPEGVVPNWYSGRAVLMGDAAHRMTPNSGLGVNCGWQDLVELTNLLHKSLTSTPDSPANHTIPTTEDITALFVTYQATRKPIVQEAVTLSGQQTRMTCWRTWWQKILDLWVMPLINGDALGARTVFGPLVQKGIVFEFLEEKSLRQGTLPWLNGVKVEA